MGLQGRLQEPYAHGRDDDAGRSQEHARDLQHLQQASWNAIVSCLSISGRATLSMCVGRKVRTKSRMSKGTLTALLGVFLGVSVVWEHEGRHDGGKEQRRPHHCKWRRVSPGLKFETSVSEHRINRNTTRLPDFV